MYHIANMQFKRSHLYICYSMKRHIKEPHRMKGFAHEFRFNVMIKLFICSATSQLNSTQDIPFHHQHLAWHPSVAFPLSPFLENQPPWSRSLAARSSQHHRAFVQNMPCPSRVVRLSRDNQSQDAQTARCTVPSLARLAYHCQFSTTISAITVQYIFAYVRTTFIWSAEIQQGNWWNSNMAPKSSPGKLKRFREYITKIANSSAKAH